jgi:MOSC domain-containing protein YiiM
MKLLSVNIGKEQPIQNGKQTGTSGIFKTPTTEPVEITTLGLAGDVVVDTKNHGGVDQAVYIFGSSDYDWWSKELGQKLVPGTFGENLTISDLESASFKIGDRLRVGKVLLEVTAPRIPCATLAARMGDPMFVKRFKQAERPGLYCRVIETGFVRAGDSVTIEPYTGETVTLIEMFRMFYERELNETDLRRLLAAPIAIRDRVDREKQLAALLAKA